MLIPILALKRKILFFQRFATLTKSGIGLLSALDHLEQRTHDPYLKSVIFQLKHHAQHGRPIADIFQAHEKYFGGFAAALIKSGELSGSLPENAQTIADYLENDYKNINRLIVGAAYPVVLLHVAILLLPAASFFTAGPSVYFRTVLWNFFLLYGFFAAVNSLYRLVQIKAKPEVDRVKMFFPVLGTLSKNISIYKFVRSLSALYRAGISSVDSWKISTALTGNTFMEKRLADSLTLLSSGETLTAAFAASRIFPSEIVDMVRTGETSGNIDGMLGKAAEYLAEQNKRTVQVILRLLPLLITLLVMGFIAFKIISFYLNYFNTLDKIIGY